MSDSKFMNRRDVIAAIRGAELVDDNLDKLVLAVVDPEKKGGEQIIYGVTQVGVVRASEHPEEDGEETGDVVLMLAPIEGWGPADDQEKPS